VDNPASIGSAGAHPRVKLWIALAGVVLPILLFYGLLSRFALSVPIFDDYDTALDFSNHMAQLHGFMAKAAYLQTVQHMEYKLVFLEAVTWLQVGLSGHVNLHALALIGNCLVVVLAFVLWKMFLPREQDLATRLSLFIPVSWLLFQLQYWQTLDWVTGTLQNFPALIFAISGMYLLFRPSRWGFAGAVICFLLTVSSSGNGLLLAPIGLVILLRQRLFARAVAWLAASAACMAAYFCRYSRIGGSGYSILQIPLHLRPMYILSFIGGALGHPFPAAALVLGIALCAFFAWLAWSGYFLENPLVGYCVLFLLLAAIGVAGIRSSGRGAAAITSRYTINSVLLLIFAWLAAVEKFLTKRPVWRSRVFLGVVGATVLFSAAMDVLGTRELGKRQRLVEYGIAMYQQPGQGDAGPVYLGDEQSRRGPFSLHARDVLAESERLGIYRLPGK